MLSVSKRVNAGGIKNIGSLSENYGSKYFFPHRLFIVWQDCIGRAGLDEPIEIGALSHFY